MALLAIASSLVSLGANELVLEWEVAPRLRKIPFVIVLDFIRLTFLRTVFLVAGSVFAYRASYMEPDKFNSRFGLLVLSFVVSICLIIASPSLIRILLGWDGLGVTSYLLVCYYSRSKRFNARILTALTNRVGDVAIIFCIAMFRCIGAYNFRIHRCSSLHYGGCPTLVLVLLARITKRAQIPLSSWLPAAIAAPTPVSALVHSSTLVTAGVYLLIRFNCLIAPWSQTILVLGLMTTTIAGIAALFELDMKKVIALSTLSQLGIMFFGLGIRMPFLAFFHLVSHAYFKAILFIAAGAIIHRVKDYQDFRKIGRRLRRTHFLGGVMLTANLSLCGLPFLRGFYSKDLILELIITAGINSCLYLLMLVATVLTLLYSLRLSLFLIVNPRARERFSPEIDAASFLKVGPRILFIPSIIGGYWLRGIIPATPLIYMPSLEKTIILCLLLSMGTLLLALPQLLPAGKRITLAGARIIWFMPILFRPALTRKFLSGRKPWLQTTDSTWVPQITWLWALDPRKINYYSNGLLRASFFRAIIMAPALTIIF